MDGRQGQARRGSMSSAGNDGTEENMARADECAGLCRGQKEGRGFFGGVQTARDFQEMGTGEDISSIEHHGRKNGMKVLQTW